MAPSPQELFESHPSGLLSGTLPCEAGARPWEDTCAVTPGGPRAGVLGRAAEALAEAQALA